MKISLKNSRILKKIFIEINDINDLIEWNFIQNLSFLNYYKIMKNVKVLETYLLIVNNNKIEEMGEYFEENLDQLNIIEYEFKVLLSLFYYKDIIIDRKEINRSN